MIVRILEKKIIDRLLNTKKSVILYGPRQVGKTTLAHHILDQLKLKTLRINADEKIYSDVLSSRDLDKINQLIHGYDVVFIDEAQRIENIGINLKIIIDQHPEIKVLATGSSSFDLANKISEPLTGRIWSFHLFPISCEEILNQNTAFEYHRNLENYLLFGSYPELLSYTLTKDKIAYLHQISQASLYKDILEFAEIKHANKITKLLQLLAYQVGNEVSLSELGNALELSKETINRYIDLLEKSFVIFRLSGFSRNLRKEVSKMDKIYFYDLGIRNSLMGNFNALHLRSDAGSLWENFLIVERMKYNHYHQHYKNTYFWRVYTGAEIDYIEEGEGKLHAYEIKWKSKASRSGDSWLKAYPDAAFSVIHQDNYMPFITDPERLAIP